MKVVIPAKSTSKRIKNKNFIPFYKEDSLLDITIKKIIKLIDKKDIYVSCDDENKRPLIEKWEVNFLKRKPELCCNDCKFQDFFNGICDDVPGDDEILWCQVIDPLFNEYKECIDAWRGIKEEHDSLIVVYPHKKYLLNHNHEPMSFGFGPDHVKSQDLPCFYELTFTLSILTRQAVKEKGYYVGNKPFWYHAKGEHIDIDTIEEFNLASKIYGLIYDKESFFNQEHKA